MAVAIEKPLLGRDTRRRLLPPVIVGFFRGCGSRVIAGPKPKSRRRPILSHAKRLTEDVRDRSVSIV